MRNVELVGCIASPVDPLHQCADRAHVLPLDYPFVPANRSAFEPKILLGTDSLRAADFSAPRLDCKDWLSAALAWFYRTRRSNANSGRLAGARSIRSVQKLCAKNRPNHARRARGCLFDRYDCNLVPTTCKD